MISTLRNPTRPLDVVQADGVAYISFDGANWNIFRDDNDQTPGTDPGGGSDDSTDYEELIAEMNAGAYGFPTRTSSGNTMFTINNINWYIIVTSTQVQLWEGGEGSAGGGTQRLPR